VLETLEQGAWGVLICCCPEDDCEHGGSKRVKARMDSLKKSLEKLDMDPKRIQIAEVPQGNPKVFTDAAKKFIDEIKGLGPLFARGE
jgi:coenzyme F420-reducing hydrogenase delta subunit